MVGEELDHNLVGVEAKSHGAGVKSLDEGGHDAIDEAVEDVRYEAVGSEVSLERVLQLLENTVTHGHLPQPLVGLEAGLTSGHELTQHPGQHDGAMRSEVTQT